MNYIAHTEKYKGYTINIRQDDCPTSPRDWDNLGTIALKDNRYVSGDEEFSDATEWLERLAKTTDRQNEHMYEIAKDKYEHTLSRGNVLRAYHEALLERIERNYIILPVYAYIHSGISLSTGPYSCPWDSGLMGWIYVPKDNVRKEYGVKRINKKLHDKVTEVLRDEIKVFGDYIDGDVYGYEVLDPQGEYVDSCWGYFGSSDDEYMLQCARDTIDYEEKSHMPLLAYVGAL